MFNCSNPTYHHEVVIILVSLIIAVVEIIQQTQTEFLMHNRRSILTRIDTVMPLHVHEKGRKEYSELAQRKVSYYY
jgi:hypothetical protein